MNIFAALGAIRARLAGVVGALTVAAGAVAGPEGTCTWAGSFLNTVTYHVWDPDGIDILTVFGGKGGGILQQIDGNCTTDIFVTIDWTADSGKEWESIVWIDCQTKHGKQRNHAHVAKVLEEQQWRDVVQDLSCLPNTCDGTPTQRTGRWGWTPLDSGLAALAVSVKGLTPNLPYEIWAQTNATGGSSVPGAMLLGSHLMADASGEGSVIDMVPLDISSIYGVTVRRGGPSGTVYASGFDGDFDDDGIRDMLDNAPHIHNPDQLDSNGDGIGDAEDCDGSGGWDFNQVNNGSDADLNRNGVVDACERPACPTDYNGDGFSNGDDFDAFVVDFQIGC